MPGHSYRIVFELGRFVTAVKRWLRDGVRAEVLQSFSDRIGQ